MNNTISRFLLKDDTQNINITVPDGDNWFSRKYEYSFASKFIEKDDICLDVGCGINHPFKYFLADKSKKCIAIDKDKNILGLEKHKGLEYKNINAIDLSKNFKESYFDKIFAISLFDRMKFDEIEKILIELKKVIKIGGLIILTISYPSLFPEKLLSICNKVGLNIFGEYDFKIDKTKVLRGKNSLKCYRLLLEKQKEKEEEKEILPEETKPEFPLETK